jgi:hypothetical protein
MADVLYGLVKFVHVLSAALWIGAGAFNVLVLQRLLATAAPETRRDFGARVFTASMRYVNATGGMTVLSGFLLLYLHPHTMANLTTSTWGKLVLAGMLLSFGVLYLINFAIRPTMRAIGKITAEMPKDLPPPASLRFLMARIRITSIFNVVLMLVTFALMIGANVVYFGP